MKLLIVAYAPDWEASDGRLRQYRLQKLAAAAGDVVSAASLGQEAGKLERPHITAAWRLEEGPVAEPTAAEVTSDAA